MGRAGAPGGARAAALALLALAAPALGMRTGTPAIDLPAKLPAVQTLDQIQHAFPGRPAPAQVVVTGGDVSGPLMRAQVAALQARASAHGVIHRPVMAQVVGQVDEHLVGVTAGKAQLIFEDGQDLRALDRPPAGPCAPGV